LPDRQTKRAIADSLFRPGEYEFLKERDPARATRNALVQRYQPKTRATKKEAFVAS
jgi:hypothetical protein